MLLNHLPIKFSSQSFTGYKLPYESSDQLKALRTQHVLTHFVLRNDNEIFLFPYEPAVKTPGAKAGFSTTDDFGVANALARQALLRNFHQRNRRISGVRPVKVVRANETSNLVKGAAASLFAIYPEYSFDVRPLAPQDGQFVNGVLINFNARFLIKPTVDELMKMGCDPRGLYVIKEAERDNPYIMPMFNRRLVGRIERIDGDEAVLLDAREERVPLSAVHVEANLKSMDHVGRAILKHGHSDFQRSILPILHTVSGAGQQLSRLQQLLESYVDLQGEMPCCDGLSVSLEGRLTAVNTGEGVGKSWRFASPQCSLKPGGTITVPWPVDARLTANGPFDSDSFLPKEPTIGVIFPEEASGQVGGFVASLRDGLPTDGAQQSAFQQGMARKYRLRQLSFAMTPFRATGDRAAAYKKASLEAAKANLDLAIVVVTDEDKALAGSASPYYTAKAALMSQGVPVQAVTLTTIRKAANAYTLNNLALQLYAKLGGIPWTLAVQQRMVYEIIVGIGSARVGFDRLSERERLVGITTVFSGDGNYLLGNATTEAGPDEYKQRLLESLRENLTELRKRYGWKRGDSLRIIFHQSFKRYKDSEAAAVAELVSELTEFNVEFAFVQVSSDHDWKLFDETSSGVSYMRKLKGEKVPERGFLVPLGPRAALVTLTGPRQLKTDLQGCPSPMLVSVHPSSTFNDLHYIAKQVFDLTFMSWRSFNPSTQPVSVSYPNMVVELLGNLRRIPNFNSDILVTRLKESRWFL